MSSSLAQCLCLPSYYGDTTIGGPDLTLCQVRGRVKKAYSLIRAGLLISMLLQGTPR